MVARWRFLGLVFACVATLVASLPSRSAASSILYRATIEDPDITATCALLFDRTAMLVTPQVTLIREVPGIVVVHFSLFDAGGNRTGTHDVAVSPPAPDGSHAPLAPFRIDRAFAGVSCAVRPDTASAPSKGPGAGVVVLGVLAAGGLVAIASSHGGGGASVSPPTTAPSATPVPPTATPTATPAPVMVSPASLDFSGSTTSLTTTASESGYTGSFTASGTSCASIATITPATSSGPFTVNALAAGICSFTLGDAAGRSAQVAVTVSTTSGTIHARRRITATPEPRKVHQ